MGGAIAARIGVLHAVLRKTRHGDRSKSTLTPPICPPGDRTRSWWTTSRRRAHAGHGGAQARRAGMRRPEASWCMRCSQRMPGHNGALVLQGITVHRRGTACEQTGLPGSIVRPSLLSGQTDPCG